MRIQWLSFSLILCASAALFAACGDTDGETSGTQGTSSSSSSSGSGTGGNGAGGNGSGGSGTAGGGPGAVCTMKTPVACSDAVIQQMNLKTMPAPGLITNTPDGAGYTSVVDAKAGGFGNPNPDSYVYGKFTAKGLEKVDISDEASLDSMDWDIAFRRYIIRVNSLSSGPSCVSAARTIPGTKYEDVAMIPDGLTYKQDSYFTDPPDCMLIEDGSGLPGSPATALSSYWTYPGCVKMTGNVFVVELADGHHVKLIVDQYYENAAAQQQCNTMDTVPMGSVGAVIKMRWTYLD